MTSWTIRTYNKIITIFFFCRDFLKISYSIQYSDKYDKELFCILDVDLTNVFHHNHEQIDIFHHICISQFHDMNDIILFYNVVMVFYYYYLLQHVELLLLLFVNLDVKQDHQQLLNKLLLMKYSIGK